MNRRSFVLRTGAVAASLQSISTQSRARAYPTKPVHLLVGGGGGSYPDLVARRFAEPLFRAMGQQVVIDSRPGAGGILAMSALGSSTLDGYTLALATMSQLVFTSFIFQKLPYDPVNDIAPVGTIFSCPMVIVANPASGRVLCRNSWMRPRSRPPVSTSPFPADRAGSTRCGSERQCAPVPRCAVHRGTKRPGRQDWQRAPRLAARCRDRFGERIPGLQG